MPNRKLNAARTGFTLIELLVVIAIIAILIGLLLPAVQKVREAAARTKCANNLKQLALGTVAYHDANGTFPTANVMWPYTYSSSWGSFSDPVAMSSFVAILPYMEQGPLYQQLYQMIYGQTGQGSFTGPLFASPVSVFACPSDPGIGNPAVVQDPAGINGPAGASYAVTSYRANGGVDVTTTVTASWGSYTESYQGGGPIGQPTDYGTPGAGAVQIVTITDGTSNTVLYGESNNFDPNWPQYATFFAGMGGSSSSTPMALIGSQWSTPYCYPVATGDYPLNSRLPATPPSGMGELTAIDSVRSGFGSGHTAGANFAFCDGSVHFITNSINAAPQVASSYNGGTESVLGALCTRDGGEVNNAGQY